MPGGGTGPLKPAKRHPPSCLLNILRILRDTLRSAPERDEIPRRLLDIFHHSAYGASRANALQQLGFALGVAEANEIARVLVDAASLRVGEGRVHPTIAFHAIRDAEEAGIPLLRTL